jgi:hypothetical protein
VPETAPEEGPGQIATLPSSPDASFWVVVDPRASVAYGIPVTLSSTAVTLREHGLSELAGHAQPVHVQRVCGRDLPLLVEEFAARLPVLAGDDDEEGPTTPRAAVNEKRNPEVVIPTRIMSYVPGGLGKHSPREILERLRSSRPTLWPLQGPLSLLWVLEFCLAQTGAFLNARVSQFMQLSRLSFSYAHMTEYSVIARTIEFGLYTDQLMITQLAAFELLARRFQLIEEKFKFRLPAFDSNKSSIDPRTTPVCSWGSAPPVCRAVRLCV